MLGRAKLSVAQVLWTDRILATLAAVLTQLGSRSPEVTAIPTRPLCSLHTHSAAAADNVSHSHVQAATTQT